MKSAKWAPSSFVFLTIIILVESFLLLQCIAVHPASRRHRVHQGIAHPSMETRYLQGEQKQKQDVERQRQQQQTGEESGSKQRVLQQQPSTDTTMRQQSYSAALRSKLLDGYDKNSFPWERVWAQTDMSNDGLRTGIPVEVGLNFHKVHEIDVTSSTADLVVWTRLSWTDPRLTWDPQEFGNITSTSFWIEHGMGGSEASEIWTPDIYLWNQEHSIAETLADTYAVVSSSGSIFWSRPGRIAATCKYLGLDQFPFDSLSCTFEFGSWAHSGLYIRPQKMDDEGFSIGGSETAGQSFAEFILADVTCDVHIYPPFIGAQEEDWPVILYHITFQRASEPYLRGYVLVQVLLNLAAFGCFWIPPQVGERMGLAITALLAAVANELTVSARLPNSREGNWFVVFAIVSMLFSVAVVFQSTVVIYFFYYSGDNLVPTYVTWIREAATKWQKRRKRINQAQREARASRAKEQNEDQDATPVNGNTSEDEDEIDKMLSSDEEGDDVVAPLGMAGFSLGGNASLRSGNASRRVSISEDTLVNMMKSSKAIVQHDAGDFQDEHAKDNNARWQRVAKLIDEFSRLIIPSLFFAFLATVFQMTR